MDPIILRKLALFATRRRRLIITRGICTAVAMLLLTMMVVAALDRLFLLPDWLRWTLSGLAYAAVLIAEWRSCWRLLLQTPGPRRLARLIEQAAPSLREDLLSAVELGEENGQFDSPQFRQLLQSSVALRLAGLEAEDLLPSQLVRRSFAIAAAAFAIFMIGFALTGWQFGTMFLRALLPMANFARVSTIKVRIIEPAPAERTVPQGDSLVLMIETSGGSVAKAYLETFSKSGSRDVIQMAPTGFNHFSAGIQVAREDVQYRVRAGDAITQKYRLHAVARPHIVRFHKTYRYPAYTELPPKQVEEEGGDLAGLEGTKVELTLETDQPVEQARLNIETSKATKEMPLEPAGPNQLKTMIPLEASGIYRVHLVATESKFENKFSPEYELKVEPDLIPRVELEIPKQDIVASANEIVAVAGTATDDLSVSSVEQLYRINDDPWKRRPLSIQPGPTAKIETRWDLFQQGFKPGDIVTLKLAAHDQKGNVGESRPIQITLAAAGFDSRRAASLREQEMLLQELIAFRVSADNLQKLAGEARAQFEHQPVDEARRKESAVSLGGALDEFDQRYSAVSVQIAKTLHSVEPGHVPANTVMIGRVLSRVNNTGAAVRSYFRAIDQDPAVPLIPALFQAIGDNGQSASQAAKSLVENYQALLETEEIDLLAENLQVVWREQKQIEINAEAAGDDPASWEQVAGRTRVVLAEMANVVDATKAATSHAIDHVDRLKRLVFSLEAPRAALSKVLAAPHATRELLTPILNFSRVTNDMVTAMFEIRRAITYIPVRSYQNLRQQAQPAWSLFDKMRQENESIIRNDKIPPVTRTRLAESRWDAKSALWKAYGDLEEFRPDSDNYFVQDLRSLALAFGSLRTDASDAANAPAREAALKKLTELDHALRMMESAHDLAEIVAGLDHLAGAERWEGHALQSHTANPADWQWLENRLKLIPEEIGRIEPRDKDLRKTIQDVQQLIRKSLQDPSARNLTAEMAQRYSKDRPSVALPHDVETVTGFVREALALLRQPLQDARQALAKIAPKLSDRMADLAKAAAELKQQTEEQAKQTESQAPEQAKQEAAEKLAAQKALDEQLGAVKDALRSDAQQQDLLKQEGRERARDADDGLAMLKEPPPRAEQALADAAASDRAEERKDALKSAAAEQQNLAAALDQLAKHYDALEKGEPADTRLALRKQEQALGLKEELNEQYKQPEQLAKAAQGSPEQMLKQLEQALPHNPLMRQELSTVSKNILNEASGKLSDAASRERAIAQSVEKLAQDQGPQPRLKNPSPVNNNANQPAVGQAQPSAQNAQASAPPKPGEQSAAAAQPDSAAKPGAQAPSTAQNNASGKPNASNPADGSKPDAQSPPAHPLLAEAARQQAPVASNAASAGDDVERAGRHEERLRNDAAAQELQRLGRQVQSTSRNEVPQAQQALSHAQLAVDARDAVDAAKQNLDNELGRLAQAAVHTPDHAGPASAMLPASNQPPSSPSPTGSQPPPGQQPGQGTSSPSEAAKQAALAGNQPNQSSPSQANAQGASQQSQSAQGSPPRGQASAQNQGASQLSQSASASQAGQPSSGAPGSPSAPSPSSPNVNRSLAASMMPQAVNSGAMPAHPPIAGMSEADPSPEAALPAAGSAGSPQQQVWMARALDSLDAALHSQNQNSSSDSAAQNAQNQPSHQQQPGGQGSQESQPQSQSSAQSMAQAQQAMGSAAQAAAAAMRATRSQPPSDQQGAATAKGGQQAVSKGGAQANAAAPGVGGLLPSAGLAAAKNGDWGKLPKKMADQLSQGQQETVAPEYRNQVETYYRVIAERAKKP